jgi:hypothetical protein
MDFACPSCGRAYTRNEEKAGAKFACDGCGEQVRVPSANYTAASVSSSAGLPHVSVQRPHQISPGPGERGRCPDWFNQPLATVKRFWSRCSPAQRIVTLAGGVGAVALLLLLIALAPYFALAPGQSVGGRGSVRVGPRGIREIRTSGTDRLRSAHDKVRRDRRFEGDKHERYRPPLLSDSETPDCVLPNSPTVPRPGIR